MNKNYSKRFYIISIAVLLVLSAYPLINGFRMAYIHFTNGILEPEQYAKYVVPYAAICISILLFAILQPFIQKLKRYAFPVGISLTFGVFFVVEQFFEIMQIRVTGMTLIDTATLIPDGTGSTTTADAWQAALCIVSPNMFEQSVTYVATDSFYYVTNNTAYKVHYYMISFILIAMVCGLIFGITKMFHTGISQKKPLQLQGISTTALLALCVFANTTAFFRQTSMIQTPLASALTGLFFIMLGVTVGIYTGSFLLRKENKLGIGIPVTLSFFVTVLMYVGEAVMMKGNIYRFGTGWFFTGIPGIILAPVDIFIILLSGGLAWLIIRIMRKYEHWPDKGTMIASVSFCMVVAATGPIITMATPKVTDEELYGCYVFYENIYTNPLSSFKPFGELPFVYGLDKDTFIIANADTGDIRNYSVEYFKTPVAPEEFASIIETCALTNSNSLLWYNSLISLFEHSAETLISQYKERYLLAVMSNESSSKYRVYRMDNEIWLVELRGDGIWSIYRIVKTMETTLEDLKHMME